MNTTKAAEWLQRLDNSKVTEEELYAWLEWFGSSDENRKAFEEMQSVYLRLRALPAEYRGEVRHKLGLSAPQAAPPRSRSLWALAATLVVAATGLGVWWNHQKGVVRELTYSAPLHRHKSIALADGSALVLGADSAASVQFTERQRAVTIERGEAYFEVRHDVQRPFIVQAGRVRVVAVGTAFNVHRDRDQVTVTVTEGVVEVEQTSATVTAPPEHTAPLRVAMGQRTVVRTDAPLPLATAANPGMAPTWRDGRVEFINAPLSEVLSVVNTDTASKLVIDDPRVADLTYSGTILREHLDEWAVSLPRIYPVRTVTLQDGTVTLVSRSRADFVP